MTTDELERLEPCPFCGADDIDSAFVRGYEQGDRLRPMVGAGCNSCGAVGPTVRVPDNSTGYAESIEIWNARADRQRRAQAAEPVRYLCQGARVKLSFSDSGKVSALANYRNELDGRWVALVAAENDRHLKCAAPAEVSEEMVERACRAYIAAQKLSMYDKPEARMRAALEAALGGGDVR